MQSLYEREKKLRKKLEIEMAKRTEFTRALVHELRTPLTPVMASSELMVDLLKYPAPESAGRPDYYNSNSFSCATSACLP